jgi:hypothetical protein
MIRTIAAALAAFVFVAFGARAEDPKAIPPATSSDTAKADTAAARKQAKKSAKKAKKAKKAAPADSSATPPAK